MVITVDQLRELPIIQSHLRIKRVIVDYKKIAVVGLGVAKPSLFGRTQIYSFDAIAHIDESGIRLEAQQRGEDRGAQSVQPTLTNSDTHGDLAEHAVFTENKRYLGKLVTYKLDTDTGKITALWVKPPLALRDLWRQILLIGRSQIVTVTPEAIIVDEAVIKSALKPATTAQLTGEPEASLGTASPSINTSRNLPIE